MSETKKAITIAPSFSIDAVAELICVHRSTVERLLESRKLGFYQVGRRRVISQTHLNRYLAQVEREPTTENPRR
jgi:excisionase family DNA binding protein